MNTKFSLFQTLGGAFFLQEDVYTGMRDDVQRIRHAFLIVISAGLIAGLAEGIGKLIQWAFSPPLDQIKAVVLTNLKAMPWFVPEAKNAAFISEFQKYYDLGWQIGSSVAPGPMNLSAILTTPLSLLVVWLIFGCLAHFTARALGGSGALSQTLACTSLACAPQLLNFLLLFPYLSVAGIGAWTLVCNFMAIRAAHGLKDWRALFAVIIPTIVLGILVALLAAVAGFIAAAVFSSMGGIK